MSYQILVVEDDRTLRETLTYNLEREGYTVKTADNGHTALELARTWQPDLVILDIMLPGMDGLEVCRRIRQEHATPILMLTARADEIDKIVGLEMGADDYMTKPFSMRELLARVKAQVRRMERLREALSNQTETAESSSPHPETLTFGNLVIDQKRREVRLDGRPLPLKPKEYDLLLFLARNQGIALSRDLILERVWGWTYDGNSRTVDVHIRWLREKIEDDPSHARRIVTIRGIGYRFEG